MQNFTEKSIDPYQGRIHEHEDTQLRCSAIRGGFIGRHKHIQIVQLPISGSAVCSY